MYVIIPGIDKCGDPVYNIVDTRTGTTVGHSDCQKWAETWADELNAARKEFENEC